jgi:hypothetical protein
MLGWSFSSLPSIVPSIVLPRLASPRRCRWSCRCRDRGDGTFTTAALPDVSTSPASYVGSSWARINGSYDPHLATYWVTFEYGTSTAYGFSAADESFIIWNVGGPSSAYADLRGIAPSTTYHCRLKLADDYGNFYYGSDSQPIPRVSPEHREPARRVP